MMEVGERCMLCRCLCVCVCMYALKLVSLDKILYCIEILIIIIVHVCMHVCVHT